MLFYDLVKKRGSKKWKGRTWSSLSYLLGKNKPYWIIKSHSPTPENLLAFLNLFKLCKILVYDRVHFLSWRCILNRRRAENDVLFYYSHLRAQLPDWVLTRYEVFILDFLIIHTCNTHLRTYECTRRIVFSNYLFYRLSTSFLPLLRRREEYFEWCLCL